MSSAIIYSVTDFVAICNQILDTSFGAVQITGELAHFKISKNKWVYFDLKDDYCTLRFFGTIYNLPGPLEDGMMLTVLGTPQLHPKFGFSITVRSIQLSGEGTIKKASQLLEQQLAKEGLFAIERKRMVPYPPSTIGLITSAESAAYADFIKIISKRWTGLEITLSDVQVQGDDAPRQIVAAINGFNKQAVPPDVLVITRGGGSADDLQAFSSEQVTRAVAASRVPTVAAVGHENDVALAELAADKRASTPSNAAELLVPDKKQEIERLGQTLASLEKEALAVVANTKNQHGLLNKEIAQSIADRLRDFTQGLSHQAVSLELLNPASVLKRGYVMVKQAERYIQKVGQIDYNKMIELQFQDGVVSANIEKNESDDEL